MTVDVLRRKRADGTPVLWQGCYGRVVRVARDGSWADMDWYHGAWEFIRREGGWSKRQPLDRLEDWQHG